MVYLAAAVAVVGVLCLLDLVLTLGVIRRLREHTSLLNRMPPGGPPGSGGLPVGETVAQFAASTTDGEPVSRERLAGRSLVGFFSPGCQPCAEQLPRFIAYAQTMDGGRERVLAVVVEDGAADTEYAERLSPAARVVAEEPGGPVHAAFRASGYPALYLLDGDLVVAAGWSMTALDGAPASATAGPTAA